MLTFRCCNTYVTHMKYWCPEKVRCWFIYCRALQVEIMLACVMLQAVSGHTFTSGARFSSRPVHMVFMMDWGATRQVSLRVFRCSPVVIILSLFRFQSASPSVFPLSVTFYPYSVLRFQSESCGFSPVSDILSVLHTHISVRVLRFFPCQWHFIHTPYSGFSPSPSVFPLSVIFYPCSILWHFS
jgi:hypothetical protein